MFVVKVKNVQDFRRQLVEAIEAKAMSELKYVQHERTKADKQARTAML